MLEPNGGVAFQQKSAGQKDGCINQAAGYSCLNESTLEAVSPDGFVRIRCCTNERCQGPCRRVGADHVVANNATRQRPPRKLPGGRVAFIQPEGFLWQVGRYCRSMLLAAPLTHPQVSLRLRTRGRRPVEDRGPGV